ncbi:MAG: outer membrane lipoprotein-sorting protein [Halioglobus sp.]|jgi:outer membrane lipoprotein-sorting protein
MTYIVANVRQYKSPQSRNVFNGIPNADSDRAGHAVPSPCTINFVDQFQLGLKKVMVSSDALSLTWRYPTGQQRNNRCATGNERQSQSINSTLNSASGVNFLVRKTAITLPVFNTVVALALLLMAPCSAIASPESDQGLAIAEEASRRDDGFGDSTADLTMLLQLSGNEPISREMRQRILEVPGDGDKIILVFDRPRDLKGTAILTYTHRAGTDDQWLYLPALKRVKRISSADKSGPFMGSEFAYEDLASQEVEKYNYRHLRDESIDDQPCFVVERTPVDTKSGYTRQVAWYDKEHYRLRQVEYYDRKNEHLKTMKMKGYNAYLEKFWRPDEMHMANHQTGKSTVLIFSNYQFKVGQSETDFNRQALSRIR